MEKRVLRQSLSRLVRGFYTSFYLKALKGMDSGKTVQLLNLQRWRGLIQNLFILEIILEFLLKLWY